MNYILLLIALIISPPIVTSSFAEGSSPRYAVATMPVPVLNTPNFRGVFGGKDGKSLQTDQCGQIRSLEFVALPGTPFRIERVIHSTIPPIYQVTTSDYPYPTSNGYFVDSRFVTTVEQPPPPRMRKLPLRREILDRLLAAVGSRYVWGGNVRDGIPAMLTLFQPVSDAHLASATLEMWQLHGVDCSGLLYEATNGFTPRNTSALVSYGKPVSISGRGREDIRRKLEPLDLLVWGGHVIIVLDRERTIESRLGCNGGPNGVVVRNIREALAEIMESRIPADDYWHATGTGRKCFVVRRWLPRESR